MTLTVIDFRNALDTDSRRLADELQTALADEPDELRQARAAAADAERELWAVQSASPAMLGALGDPTNAEHRWRYLNRQLQVDETLTRPHELRLQQLDDLADLVRDVSDAAAIGDLLPSLANATGAAHRALAAYQRARDKAIADLERLQRQCSHAELERRQLAGVPLGDALVVADPRQRNQPSRGSIASEIATTRISIDRAGGG